MISIRTLGFRAVALSLVLCATPALAARSSRQGFSGPTQGKLGPDLYLAIIHGDQAGVQALLKQGADPDARNSLDMTPLVIAAATGQVPVVESLLGAGATLDATTPYGTALTFAALGGSDPVMKLLLARGANPNPPRPDGTTVLMLAARAGDTEVVRDLLSRKVDVNTKDGDGATALTYAAREGRVDSGRVLLGSGAAVDAVDSHRWTALMHAAVSGQTDFVKLLLEKGAKVNAREEKGRTPLILTAMYGDHPEVLRALVEGGADPKATVGGKRTALALASARGYGESVAFLRERAGEAAVAESSRAERTPKEAAQASLAALQRSMRVFNQNTGCVSCHQDGLGRMATGLASQQGFAIDRALAQAEQQRIDATWTELRPLLLKAVKDPSATKNLPLIEIGDVASFYGFTLGGMLAHKQPANEAVSAAALVLARQQLPDGQWMPFPRGPMQSSQFTMTALAIQVMQAYAPKDHAAEVADHLQKARAWLLSAPAKTSEDKALRLLGLKWAGASPDEMRKPIDELRADQRPDGGWPQPLATQSDGYGTGQALYALHVAGGIPVTDPAYQKGVQFLLRTQEEDGSWFVPKRVVPLNNHFDADFPYGEAQYASFNATCWAAMALMQGTEPAHSDAERAAR